MSKQQTFPVGTRVVTRAGQAAVVTAELNDDGLIEVKREDDGEVVHQKPDGLKPYDEKLVKKTIAATPKPDKAAQAAEKAAAKAKKDEERAAAKAAKAAEREAKKAEREAKKGEPTAAAKAKAAAVAGHCPKCGATEGQIDGLNDTRDCGKCQHHYSAKTGKQVKHQMEKLLKPDLSRYVSVAETASGNPTKDIDDQVAQALRGKSVAEVFAHVEQAVGLPSGSLEAKYAKLNVGMQRMNAGNILRGHLNGAGKREEKAAAKAQRDAERAAKKEAADKAKQEKADAAAKAKAEKEAAKKAAEASKAQAEQPKPEVKAEEPKADKKAGKNGRKGK